MNTATPVVEFRIRPEYRRCGIYFTSGLLLIAGLLIWINHAIVCVGPGFDHLATALSVTSTLGLLPFVFRLRVDKRGVWRRWLLGWEHWSWDDFAGSQFRLGTEDRSYVDPRRPWWRPHFALTLAFLAPADAAQVASWIALVWKPLPPPTPDGVDLRYLFSSTAHFDNAGIRVGNRRTSLTFAWTDVKSLEIERLRHDREDFQSLKLKLPNQTISLRLHDGNPNWRGPDANIVAQFLIARVPADRQLVCALLDPPRTLREADWRVEKGSKRVHETRQLRWLIWGVAAALFAWFVIDRDPRALAHAIMIVLMIVPVAHFLCRDAQTVHELVLQWRDELASANSSAAEPEWANDLH